jgi:hypothetical protein
MIRYLVIIVCGTTIGVAAGFFAPHTERILASFEEPTLGDKKKGEVRLIDKERGELIMNYNSGFEQFPPIPVRILFDENTRFGTLQRNQEDGTEVGARLTFDAEDIPRVGDSIIASVPHGTISATYILTDKRSYEK